MSFTLLSCKLEVRRSHSLPDGLPTSLRKCSSFLCAPPKPMFMSVSLPQHIRGSQGLAHSLACHSSRSLWSIRYSFAPPAASLLYPPLILHLSCSIIRLSRRSVLHQCSTHSGFFFRLLPISIRLWRRCSSKWIAGPQTQRSRGIALISNWTTYGAVSFDLYTEVVEI